MLPENGWYFNKISHEYCLLLLFLMNTSMIEIWWQIRHCRFCVIFVCPLNYVTKWQFHNFIRLYYNWKLLLLEKCSYRHKVYFVHNISWVLSIKSINLSWIWWLTHGSRWIKTASGIEAVWIGRVEIGSSSHVLLWKFYCIIVCINVNGNGLVLFCTVNSY